MYLNRWSPCTSYPETCYEQHYLIVWYCSCKFGEHSAGRLSPVIDYFSEWNHRCCWNRDVNLNKIYFLQYFLSYSWEGRYRNYSSDEGSSVRLRYKLLIGYEYLWSHRSIPRLKKLKEWDRYYGSRRTIVRNSHFLNKVWSTSVILDTVSERRNPLHRWWESKSKLWLSARSSHRANDCLVPSSEERTGDPGGIESGNIGLRIGDCKKGQKGNYIRHVKYK